MNHPRALPFWWSSSLAGEKTGGDTVCCRGSTPVCCTPRVYTTVSSYKGHSVGKLDILNWESQNSHLKDMIKVFIVLHCFIYGVLHWIFPFQHCHHHTDPQILGTSYSNIHKTTHNKSHPQCDLCFIISNQLSFSKVFIFFYALNTTKTFFFLGQGQEI